MHSIEISHFAFLISHFTWTGRMKMLSIPISHFSSSLATFQESLDEYRLLSKIVPWTAVIRQLIERILLINRFRSYMEGKGRGAELKQQQGEEKGKEVKDIMKSITNVRNDRAKKDQAKKWSNMPAETKGKVIGKWEEKAKAAK